MLIAFVSCYLVITLFIGYLASKRVKNSSDYILAGRNLPSIMVGVTIFSTWFGSEMIMGLPAIFIEEGIKGLIIDCGGSILSLGIIAYFFTKPIYRLKIYTISDFFRLRFGKRMEIVTSLIIVFSYFSWVASQFLALAFIFQSLFDLPLVWGLVISASVVLFYTYIGGMWAVSITDLIQAILMTIGLLAAFYVFWRNGDYIFPEQKPQFWNILPEKDWSDYFGKWAVFGVGAIVSQEIYQRMLAAKSQNHAKSGVLLGGILMVCIGIIPSLTGLLISAQHPELLTQNNGQNLLVDAVLGFFSMPMKVIFFGALISAILSTASGAILAPATVLSENLFFAGEKKYSDKRLLYITRLSTVFMTLGAAIYALFQQNIHSLVVESVTLITVGLTAPFVFGLYWDKTSKKGAWIAIFAGIAGLMVSIQFFTHETALLLGIASSTLFLVLGSLFFPDDSSFTFKKMAVDHIKQHSI